LEKSSDILLLKKEVTIHHNPLGGADAEQIQKEK
jgi:hypothetical protein